MPRTAVAPRLDVHRGRYRQQADDLLERARQHFTYGPGENRASDYLSTDLHWVTPIIDDLEELAGVRFTILALQGYKDGAACTPWHSDANFGVQAILSLGATRMFGIRRDGNAAVHLLHAGDLIVMPAGFQDVWEHRVIPDPAVTGERVALVFRTP